MKLVLGAGVALAFTTIAASADQFAGMYGNTVHVTDTDGSQSTVFVNADHTWEQRLPDGKVARGTYAWKDDTHFCMTITEPGPKPGEQAEVDCHEISGDHKAGDTWNMAVGDGKSVQLSITAGR